jgi:hypothetical protein
MAETTTTETVATAEAPVNPEARNATFAQQLRDELNEAVDGPEPVTAADTPAAKGREAEADRQISAKRIAELLKDWDEEALSKELGIDRKDLRVKNSKFVHLRQSEKKARNQIGAEKQAIEQERITLRQQREQLVQSQATLMKVADLVKNEDFAGAIELVFGKPFDEVQRLLVQNSLDPSAKETRRLRAEIEHSKREQQERDEAARKERETQEQTAARNQYISNLRTELFEDEELGLSEFADHPKLPVFLSAVFNEQQKAYNPVTDSTISAKKAAQQAIAILTAEAEAWSPYLTKFGSGAQKKTAEQSPRGATKAASRSVARAQSGAPAPSVKEMSPQERNAYFARQLRAELNSNS